MNREEELKFLQGELKKVEEKISEKGYSPSTLSTQEKLWQLREIIWEQICDLESEKDAGTIR